MLVIGCDFHPSWQQVCWVDTRLGKRRRRSWFMVRGRPSVSIGSFPGRR